jgi:hypothetical protein
MGSLGDEEDVAKGKHPALGRFQRHLVEWNERCARRGRAAPVHLKVLAWLGFRKPYYRWQQRHWYDF